MSDVDKLFKACRVGDLLEVKRLHASGVDIHSDDDWSFREVCIKGHLELVKYLVENGADIHTGDDFVLRYASESGHLEVVGYLQSVDRVRKLARLLK